MVIHVNHTERIEMRKKREQITLDFPKDLRLRAKIQAIKRGMSLKDWMMCVIAEVINRELELENS
jgi:hypothetical protein